jgi:hypothetical protein
MRRARDRVAELVEDPAVRGGARGAFGVGGAAGEERGVVSVGVGERPHRCVGVAGLLLYGPIEDEVDRRAAAEVVVAAGRGEAVEPRDAHLQRRPEVGGQPGRATTLPVRAFRPPCSTLRCWARAFRRLRGKVRSRGRPDTYAVLRTGVTRRSGHRTRSSRSAKRSEVTDPGGPIPAAAVEDAGPSIRSPHQKIDPTEDCTDHSWVPESAAHVTRPAELWLVALETARSGREDGCAAGRER